MSTAVSGNFHQLPPASTSFHQLPPTTIATRLRQFSEDQEVPGFWQESATNPAASSVEQWPAMASTQRTGSFRTSAPVCSGMLRHSPALFGTLRHFFGTSSALSAATDVQQCPATSCKVQQSTAVSLSFPQFPAISSSFPQPSTQVAMSARGGLGHRRECGRSPAEVRQFRTFGTFRHFSAFSGI